VYVHRLQANEGDVLELDSVMLVEDNNQVRIGQPYLADTKENQSFESPQRR
jgi:ribosomal protein L21